METPFQDGCRSQAMSTGVIVLTGDAHISQNTLLSRPIARTSPAPGPVSVVAPASAPVSAHGSLLPQPGHGVYTRRRRVIPPLMQYRPKPKYSGISEVGGPRSGRTSAAKTRSNSAALGRTLGRDEADLNDWSMHSDMVARCFQEMLRGESISVLGSTQVRSFTEGYRTAWCNSRDEEVALKSRSLAYAEVMAIREADNAAAAERRDQELREQAIAITENKGPAVNGLAENQLKKPTLTRTHEQVARAAHSVPRESQQPPSAMRVPVKVTVSSNMQAPPDRAGNKNFVSPPGPPRSCLREQRRRKRRHDLKTDEFIRTMTATVSEDHCKVCNRDVIDGHTSALLGHAKLLERYSSSLMPASQNPARDCKKVNRTAKELKRKKALRTFDDSFLTNYYGELMERIPDTDHEMSCDLDSPPQTPGIGGDYEVDSSGTDQV